MRRAPTIASSIRFSGVIAACILSLAACDNEPGKDKTKAVVSPAVQETPAASAKPVEGVTYNFDAKSSKVEFVGAKVTGKHEGGFGRFEGSVVVPGGNVEAASVQATIYTDSLSADSERLTGHLKSGDFLDVEKHPTAKFVSTAIKPGGDDGATHTIVGNLTIRGVAKSISFPGKVAVDEESAKLTAEFVINRKDFGIEFPGKPDDLIKDDVLMKLTIHAKPG